MEKQEGFASMWAEPQQPFSACHPVPGLQSMQVIKDADLGTTTKGTGSM